MKAQAQELAQEQAQEQAQELAVQEQAQEQTALTANVLGMKELADNLGYTLLHTQREDDGKVFLPVWNKDEKEVMYVASEVKDAELKSLNDVEDLENWRQMSPVLVAWKCHELRELAVRSGFTSVGAFINKTIPSLSANTANQWANVAKEFMELPEGCTVPAFKYEWCKGVPVSNLALILGEWHKCDEDAEVFEETWLKGDNMLTLRNQNKLKEELKAVRGTSKKGSSKAQAQAQEQEGAPTVSTASAWADIAETMLKAAKGTEHELDTAQVVARMEYMLDILGIVPKVAPTQA